MLLSTLESSPGLSSLSNGAVPVVFETVDTSVIFASSPVSESCMVASLGGFQLCWETPLSVDCAAGTSSALAEEIPPPPLGLALRR